jgi:hypothetical protein
VSSFIAPCEDGEHGRCDDTYDDAGELPSDIEGQQRADDVPNEPGAGTEKYRTDRQNLAR